MNKEDFERLKAVCEKEGFELLKSLPDKDTNFHILAVSKKDIWDGVEFAICQEVDSTIRKIIKTDDKYGGPTLHFSNGDDFIRSYCKPSTESAYIEQLKKEAHERFGDIKEGVVIDNSMINSDYPKESKIYGNNFYYEKEEDRLLVGSKDIRTCIYQQGKWATRMKERVEVEFGWTEKKIALMKTPVALFTNKSTKKSIFDGKTSNEICDIFTFLAKQLEKYLNGEVE